MRRALGRSVAVANALGIVAPIGILAVAILALMTPLTFAAHDIMLNKDQVALLEALSASEFLAGLGDVTDILVAHDCGRSIRWRLEQLHIRAADTGNFHLQQRRILRNVRHREFADLHLAWAGTDRRSYHLCHMSLLLGAFRERKPMYAVSY